MRQALRACFSSCPSQPAFVQALQALALADRGFQAPAAAVVAAADVAGSWQAAALQLEEQLLFAGDNGEGGRPAKQRRVEAGSAGAESEVSWWGWGSRGDAGGKVLIAAVVAHLEGMAAVACLMQRRTFIAHH